MTCAHQLDLVIELPALRRGQLAQRFDGDGELPTGAPLVPHSADYTINEQHRVVAGLGPPGERAGASVRLRPRVARDEERVEVGQ